mgnify:CR=1 FL=1
MSVRSSGSTCCEFLNLPSPPGLQKPVLGVGFKTMQQERLCTMQTNALAPVCAKHYNSQYKEISDYGHDAQGLPVQVIGDREAFIYPSEVRAPGVGDTVLTAVPNLLSYDREACKYHRNPVLAVNGAAVANKYGWLHEWVGVELNPAEQAGVTEIIPKPIPQEEHDMSDIIQFTFEAQTVRIVQMDGEPWFVAKDVAVALGYSRPADAIAQHCKKAQLIGKVGDLPTLLNLHPQTKIIPESDVYRLIFRSKLPSAESFETKVVEEVLPSIRKTGSYQAGSPLPPHLQAIQDLVLLAAENERRISAVESRLDGIEGGTGYATIKGYARQQGIEVPLKLANELGRKAKALCEVQGIEIGQVPDERFGRVNSYPLHILEALV